MPAPAPPPRAGAVSGAVAPAAVPVRAFPTRPPARCPRAALPPPTAPGRAPARGPASAASRARSLKRPPSDSRSPAAPGTLNLHRALACSTAAARPPKLAPVILLTLDRDAARQRPLRHRLLLLELFLTLLGHPPWRCALSRPATTSCGFFSAPARPTASAVILTSDRAPPRCLLRRRLLVLEPFLEPSRQPPCRCALSQPARPRPARCPRAALPPPTAPGRAPARVQHSGSAPAQT